jgi:hypothetical protein
MNFFFLTVKIVDVVVIQVNEYLYFFGAIDKKLRKNHWFVVIFDEEDFLQVIELSVIFNLHSLEGVSQDYFRKFI